jgi:hypothetical protein
LVNHAAEQQKYQQSLSPEDKAQMLRNKADGEKYQRKSLPPKKKARLLDTNAAT